MRGQALIVIVIVSFPPKFLPGKIAQHWTSSLKLPRRSKHATGCTHSQGCSVPGSINSSEDVRFGKIFFPWVGVAINEHMIRNLSKTWGEIAGATTKAIANQEKSLHSLVLVLDLFLPISYWTSGVCSVVNISCCTWRKHLW